MKVRLFAGALKLVEKSGVGQAVFHQQKMLESAGVEVTRKQDRDVSIVHINTVFPDSFCAAVLAGLRGQKVVYYGHSTMEDFRNSFRMSNLLAPIFKRWIRWCYSAGDVIITPTEYSRRLLLSYGIRKPVYALSNGIAVDSFCYEPAHRRRFREKYRLSDEDRAVLSVGHYMQRKGILDFIALARRMPQTRFFWFGYTSPHLVPAEVKQAIAGAPPNLSFPGYVNQEELRDAYCGCDLFCFMSHEETEGIVVLEALASKIPVLVRDIPVYEGWLRDGVNVYKERDAAGFLTRAEEILSGSARDLTEEGYQTARQRSIPATGRRLLKIYEEAFGLL